MQIFKDVTESYIGADLSFYCRWILGNKWEFYFNFKRFDCFPWSGVTSVRAFLVVGLDLSTRAWRDARSPSCRPCGRPLTLTHTRTRTGTALGGALGLSLTWRERVTTHEPLSIHPSPVLFSHPQLSIDPARETTLCSALSAERGKKNPRALRSFTRCCRHQDGYRGFV